MITNADYEVFETALSALNLELGRGLTQPEFSVLAKQHLRCGNGGQHTFGFHMGPIAVTDPNAQNDGKRWAAKLRPDLPLIAGAEH